MSDTWEVSLQLVEGGSKKFWRARVEGGTLYVNYGRIGTTGQTQVKELGTDDKARAELDKVAGSKRRKGYADAGDAVAASSTAAAAPVLSVVPAKELDKAATLSFTSGGRTIEARLMVEGGVLKTEVAERFAGDEAAAAALDRARKALRDDGWREG
ncbi:WGR domain-containing protein [Paraliomyxa miuraensis]|uniref:WGR domain-containing protein n=1 Tax=Paraliomyxa miuraensis TaxID=376150 RepID=UPI0022523F04|nr:WGR domain-containing protein [Paraliomyxa miuraensis]MCX4243900.1 WGR domain-containing protein [Paraliomyxa miuraensis]